MQNINGVKCILSSGGTSSAIEGTETLNAMIKVAGGYPVIVVAGKVTKHNTAAVQHLTDASEFHGKIVENL